MTRIRLFFATLALVLVAAAAVAVPQLAAQTPTAGGADLPRTITVVGQGKAGAMPDRARVTLGVESVASSAQTAAKDNSKRMDDVLAALKKAGASDKDIKTAYYSIWTETLPGDGQTTTVRYHVTNQLTVVVNDINKVSAMIDAAINAGATTVNGVEFEAKDTSALEGQARAAAIKDAQARAAELAKLNGVKLGGVVEVTEVIGGASPVMFKDGLGGGGAPQIIPGELSITTQVQVTYELLR